MRISCIQMDMQLGQPDRNFAHARELIERAVSEERPDTVVLPETWNTGFFPKEDLAALSDRDGERVRKEIGPRRGQYRGRQRGQRTRREDLQHLLRF